MMWAGNDDTVNRLKLSLENSGSNRYSLSLVVLVFFLSFSTYPVLSDQTHAQLPELFDNLRDAQSPEASRDIETRIWQLWLEAPDEASYLLMSQVTEAMSTGQLKIALSLSNQLIDGAPEYSEAWNKRATIHYLMGNDDDSVADIRETLALEPKHFGAISGLGLIFMRQGNLEAALDAFEQVLVISPASSSAKLSIERVREELGREI